MRVRLLQLVAAVALPLLALAALAVWRAYDGERLRIGERLTGEARAMAISVDREFDRAQALLELLATAPSLQRGDLPAFETEMRALSAVQFDGEHLSLTGTDGRQIINTAWPPGTRREAAPGSEAAHRVLMSATPVVTDIYTGIATGVPTVAVVVPVALPGPGSGPGPGHIYALSGAVPLPRLSRVLSQQGVPKGWAAAVIDRAGIVAARTARPDMVGRPATPAVRRAISGVREVGLPIETPTLEGVRSAVALGRAPRSGYWVALAAPMAAFTRPLHLALLQILTIGAGLLAVGLILAVGLARRIGASLRVLAELGTAGATVAQPAGLREVDDVAAALAAAERRRRVLVAELNHRVKNVLATVQSVVVQTLRSRPNDLAGSGPALTARLRALAAAHDLITAGSWEGAPLAAVLRGALAPWMRPDAPPRIRIGPLLEEVQLAPLQAQALVLALNELATNAVNHGALSSTEGRVEIGASRDAGGLVVLTWTEIAGPRLSGAPDHQGFGTRLLRRALAQDLGPGAQVELRFEPSGLVASIGFRPKA